VVEQHPPGGRQRDAPGPALEQRGARGALEGGDLLRDRGPAEGQVASGGGERPAQRYGAVTRNRPVSSIDPL